MNSKKGLSKSIMKDRGGEVDETLTFYWLRGWWPFMDPCLSLFNHSHCAFLWVPRNSIYENKRTLPPRSSWSCVNFINAFKSKNNEYGIFPYSLISFFILFSLKNLDSVLRFLFSTFDFEQYKFSLLYFRSLLLIIFI